MLPRGQAPLKVQRTEQKPRSLEALVAAIGEALGGFLWVVDTGLCLDKKLDSGAGPPPPRGYHCPCPDMFAGKLFFFPYFLFCIGG